MKTFTKNINKTPQYLRELFNKRDNPILLEQLRVKEYSNRIPILKGNRSVIIPWSGGLDSTTSLMMALESGNDVYTVNINYGQDYWEKEMQTIKELRDLIKNNFSHAESLWKEHYTINIAWMNKVTRSYLPGEWQHIFPLRNYIILKEASLIKKTLPHREIWFSCVQGEIPFSGGDKSIVFLTEIAKELLEQNHILVTPLIGFTKTDIVQWSISNKSRYTITKRTISCFSGSGNQHCGACLACFNRLVGFYSAGMINDCGFKPNYKSLKPFVEKYQDAFLRENSYSPSRKESTIKLISYLQTLHD